MATDKLVPAANATDASGLLSSNVYTNIDETTALFDSVYSITNTDDQTTKTATWGTLSAMTDDIASVSSATFRVRGGFTAYDNDIVTYRMRLTVGGSTYDLTWTSTTDGNTISTKSIAVGTGFTRAQYEAATVTLEQTSYSRTKGADGIYWVVDAFELEVVYTPPAKLLAGSGSYTLTGKPVGFPVLAGSGSYALTGANASFSVAEAEYVDTYYFDASISGPTDTTSSWTNDANAVDGDTGTAATATVGSTGILTATGTTAPTTGKDILQVRFRVYTSMTNSSDSLTIDVKIGASILATIVKSSAHTPEWSSWTYVKIPTGGWTWSKVSDSLLFAANRSGSTDQVTLRKVEIEVTSTDRSIYYVDASDDAAAGTNWANPAYCVDGGQQSGGQISTPNVNTLFAGGTTAPTSGGSIDSVNVRVAYYLSAFDSLDMEVFTNGKAESLWTKSLPPVASTNSLSAWEALSTPSGGWDWTKVAALEFEATPVYTSGSGIARIYVVQIAVKGTTTPTLSAGSGSYSVTGSAAAFKRSLKMLAGSGSYALTGSAAAFLKGVTLSADAGSYSLTGGDVAYLRGYALPADAGSYTLSGANAAFQRGLVMQADAGSYSLTGSSADFSLDFTLLAGGNTSQTTGYVSGAVVAKYWTSTANWTDGDDATYAAVTRDGDMRALALSVSASLEGITAVDYRFKGQIVGTGSPYIRLTGSYSPNGPLETDSLGEYLDETFSLATADWSNWLPATPVVGDTFDWGTLLNDSVWRVYSILNGGTITQARAYQSEVRITHVDSRYTLAGHPVAFYRDLYLGAESGSYALTGSDAAFQRHLILQVDAGSYSLNGSAADFILSNTLMADAGAYTLTGADVAFLRGLALPAGSGSYTYTGVNADLITANQFTLDAGSGSYSLSGVNAAFLNDWVVQADAGSYSLGGADASLNVGWALGVEAGAYTITGSAVQFLRGYALPAATGSYSITGSDVAFKRDLIMLADAGAYTLTGYPVILSYSFDGALAANPGNYALTGAAADFKRDLVLSAGSGTYTITGASVAFGGNVNLLAESGSYAVTGGDAAFARSLKIAANSGSYSFTGSDVNLDLGFTVAANAGSYSLAGSDVQFVVAGSSTRRIIMIG